MTLNVRIFFVLVAFHAIVRGISLAQPANPPVPLSPATPPELASLLAATPTWSTSVAVHASAGYKDNLLLSRFSPEGSAFVRGGVEALLWHVPRGSVDYFGFLNAETSKYFSGDLIDHDATVFSRFEWRYRHGEIFSFNVAGTGYYMDQVLDLSDIAPGTIIDPINNERALRTTGQFKRTGGEVGPTVRWSVVPWLWIEGGANAGRETYRDGSNNATFRDGTARVGWNPNDRFELSAAAIARRRDYDNRVQYSLGGIPQDNTVLEIEEREFEGRCAITWGRARHWKTTTRGGKLHYTDNGSGYLNYREQHVSQEVEWAVGVWSVHAQGEAARKEYELQRVGVGTPTPQVEDNFLTAFRIERQLGERWTLYAEYRWERSRSNYDVASYRMNEGLLGARWSWEK